jgi:hypothetical protein
VHLVKLNEHLPAGGFLIRIPEMNAQLKKLNYSILLWKSKTDVFFFSTINQVLGGFNVRYSNFKSDDLAFSFITEV